MRQLSAVLLFFVAAVSGQESLSVITVEPMPGKLVEGEPAIFGQPTRVDSAFRFGETNITNIRDIELFPDGTIAYGGAGSYATVGLAQPDGTPINPNSGGVLMSVANSISLDVADRAVYGGGAGLSTYPGGGPAVTRMAGWDDFTWSFFGNLRGGVSTVLTMADRDVLLGGWITIPGDTNSYGLVRLDLAGGIDAGFAYTNFAGLNVKEAAVTADGKILAAYETTNEISYLRPGFGRWLANGERDTNYDGTWAVTWGTNTHVTVIRKAPGTNGFVVVQETWLAGPDAAKATRLIRLDEEGRPVDWMSTEDQINGVVHAIAFEAVRPETAGSNSFDRIIVGGEFTHIGETPYNKLAAISKDGPVEWGFGAGEGPVGGTIHAVEVQSDGKVLIGGSFTNIGTTEAKGVARLEGNNGSGQTYLYWADTEFRGFEQSGQVELKLVRDGNTNEALSVFITGAASPGVTQFQELPSRVEFAAGQSLAIIPLAIGNDSLRENRHRFEIRASVTNENVLVTRARAEFVILDDETPGTLDPKFSWDSALIPSAMAVQVDGKVLLAIGTRMMRLNTDGSVDSSFLTNAIPARSGNWEVSQIEPQASGKIYIAGRFNTSTSTYGINLVARLNADGTLDTGFDPRLSAAAPLGSTTRGMVIDVLDDGDILMWPVQATVTRQGTPLSGIHRLNDKGAMEATYQMTFPGMAKSDSQKIVHMPSGEFFAYSSGLSSSRVFKYSVGGVQDLGFVLTVPTSRGWIYDMAVIDGSLLIGGSFKQLNGGSISNIARINVMNGEADTNFNAVVNGEINAIRAGEGKIYISGVFSRVNGRERNRVARLNMDGSLDETFDPGFGPNQSVGTLGIQTDGSVIIGAGFDRVDGVPTGSLVRLKGEARTGEIRLVSRRMVVSETNGVAVIELERVGGSVGTLSATLETIEGSALEGMNFVATNLTVTFADGEFGRRTMEVPITAIAGVTGARTFGVRFKSGSQMDQATVLIRESSSLLGESVFLGDDTNAVRDIAVGADGSVYLAGWFTNVNGWAVTNLARLNSDLSVATNFSLTELPVRRQAGGVRVVVPIDAVTVRTNGKVIFSGQFTDIGTNQWGYLAQLNRDGSYDEPFILSNKLTKGVPVRALDLLIQPDEKLIASAPDALWRRLNVDGTLDSGFGADFPHGGPLSLDSLGRIYSIVGSAMRYRPDGRRDSNFNVQLRYAVTGSFPPSFLLDTVVVQPDDKVLLGGAFTEPRPRLARLHPDGQADTNFVANVGTNAPGTIPKNRVTAVQLLSDGCILVGGNFEEVEGKRRSMLALLDSDGKLRDDFSAEVEGDKIDQFGLLPDGDVIVRGVVKSVDGVEVGQVFKMGIPKRLPPAVQILWPTNGTEFLFSDAVVPFEVVVKAFDVDGFLENVVVALDGVAVATNDFGGTFFLNRPGDGEHVLMVTATDEHGMVHSQTVGFSVRTLPFPGQVEVRREGNGVVIRYPTARLQSSSDLRTWVDVHSGGGDFRASGAEKEQFFRVAF